MKRLLLPLLIVIALASLGPAGDATAGRLRGLPRHFGIGLAAQPDASGIYGWMPNSRIPFDYAYQYLAGGVNTEQGWQTWNANAKFPLLYARGAHRNGYIPVFPYYMLLQSDGPCGGCNEAQKDLAHLNSPNVMAAYYRDFQTLMRRLGEYGRTAIVHVEPDLSGYGQQAVLNPAQNCYGFCTGRGNDPSLLRASVRSSGVSSIAGYSNTYRGFNLALLHLRDRLAPKVLLAFHVSDWATGYDIGSQRDAADARALGRKAGTFAARAGVLSSPRGVSTYDLVFNDVADRDAAYYKYVFGADVFWDRTNRTVPNFRRWERYIRRIKATTHRRVMIWQIPVGNQYFRTENNADGHYQDNRVAYFFHHIRELTQVGVIGLLFGAGNAGSTTYSDAKHDGVTNPPSFCTRDGTSGKAICNTHQSTVADDDGGYLRMQARRYYRSPVALP